MGGTATNFAEEQPPSMRCARQQRWSSGEKAPEEHRDRGDCGTAVTTTTSARGCTWDSPSSERVPTSSKTDNLALTPVWCCRRQILLPALLGHLRRCGCEVHYPYCTARGGSLANRDQAAESKDHGQRRYAASLTSWTERQPLPTSQPLVMCAKPSNTDMQVWCTKQCESYRMYAHNIAWASFR